MHIVEYSTNLQFYKDNLMRNIKQRLINQTHAINQFNSLTNKSYDKITANPIAEEEYRRYSSVAQDPESGSYLLCISWETEYNLNNTTTWYIYREADGWKNTPNAKFFYDTVFANGIGFVYDFILVEPRKQSGKARKAKPVTLNSKGSLNKLQAISLGTDATGQRFVIFEVI